MIKKLLKSDNYDVAYLEEVTQEYTETVIKTLQSKFNQASFVEQTAEISSSQEIDISEFQRRIEFYKILSKVISAISDEKLSLEIIQDFSKIHQSDLLNSIIKDIFHTEDINIGNSFDFQKTLRDEIEFSKLCRGMEFVKALNHDKILNLNYSFDTILDYELEDKITELQNKIEYFKGMNEGSTYISNLILSFSKTQNISDFTHYYLGFDLKSSLSNIINYSELCRSIEFKKILSNSKSIDTESNIIISKNLALNDIVTITSGIVTSLSFSKLNSLIPNINLDSDILFAKFNSLGYNSLFDYNFEYGISELLWDSITSDFTGLVNLSFSKTFGIKPFFSLILPQDRLAGKVVKKIYVTAKQIPISISAFQLLIDITNKEIPSGISIFSG